MKPLNSRAKICVLIVLVCSAMTLGGLPRTFDNKPLWWITFVLCILSLAGLLFFFIRDTLNSQSKTFLFLFIALLSGGMTLGSLPPTFDKPLWWIAFVGSILSMALCLFVLIRDIWKSDI
jgi:FtsH-binding integral membrane protein